jgi:hypothetical protein
MGFFSSFVLAYAVAWLYVPASLKADYFLSRLCHAIIFVLCFWCFLWYPGKAFFLREANKVTYARAVRIAESNRIFPLRPPSALELKEAAVASKINDLINSGTLETLTDQQVELLIKYGYGD